MLNRRNLLKILVVIFVAAVSGMFAAVFCGCAEKDPSGVYVLGTEDGEIVTKMTVGKKKVTLVTKTDTAEYSYKRSGNKLTLDTGVEIVFAEGGDVIYMPHFLAWRNGYVSSSNLFGPLRQRDGYFTQVFSTEKGGKVTSEMVFAKDGGFSMLVYNNNQITGHSYGTYELESGLLTINDVSAEEKTEQVFFYVDGDYNIYRSAGVKQTSSLYKPADPDNSGTVTPPDKPDIPDKPDTPDKPDIPDKTEYTLTYAAGVGGRIIGTASQKVLKGESGASVIAVADDGYGFIGWSDGVETAERQDRDVKANISVTAEFEWINADFSGGAGTQESPYRISNAEQLKNVGKYPNAHFALANDIVFGDDGGQSNFTPLFSDDNMFNGVFDGNGYKISNLKIVNTQTFYTGLFACVGANGTVKNLTLENVNVSGTNYIGAVAAYSLGVIENCNVTGEIDYLAENSYKVFIGGIAGRAENLLNNCAADVDIFCDRIKGAACVGGIAGELTYNPSDKTVISNFRSDGDIECLKASDLQVGGLFGSMSLGSYVSLESSHATGNVTATASSDVYAGGLAGYSNGSVDGCYSTGNVTAAGSYVYAGGLAGKIYGAVDGCYSTGNVTVTTGHRAYAGGLAGELDYGLKISNSFAVGDLSVILKRDSGEFYVGGLIGRLSTSYDVEMICCYAAGRLTVAAEYDDTVHTPNNSVYIGGLIGSGYGVTIKSSYTVCMADVSAIALSDKTYIGGVAGRTNSFKLENVHWLYCAESEVEYAIGYGSDMGIPSSIGATKHTEISDFYTLADALNQGLEKPVWEHAGDAALPSLKKEND